MKYSEFHYERISVEEQNELLNERLERFNNAASADEQIAVITSRFEEGCLESIVGKVWAWLDGVDVAKL